MGAFVQELFRVGLYKRNQGRIARQATFAALAVIFSLGAWALSEALASYAGQHTEWQPWVQHSVHYLIPLGFLLIGLWASFRLVNMPAFADFLISVEGEMNKVSWPSRGELFRASMVVMAVIFFLAALLFFYDYVLTWILNRLDGIVSWLFG